MSSFFHNLYRFRQRESRNSKEDFLTEILAECLRSDVPFRTVFLAHIGIPVRETHFTCQTQLSINDIGRFDLFITSGDEYAIIIECKIESNQGPDQLAKYANYLKNSGYSKPHLVFLTRHHEIVSDPLGINFHRLKWHQVFEMAQSGSTQFTENLANFLNTEKMSSIVLFNQADINSIRAFNKTIGKIKDFIHLLKQDVLSPRTRKRIKEELSNMNDFGVACKLDHGYLWMGLWQYDDHDEMQIGISINTNIQQEKSKVIHRTMTKANWPNYEENGYTEWYRSSPISSFFIEGSFDTKLARIFLNQCLDEIQNLL